MNKTASRVQPRLEGDNPLPRPQELKAAQLAELSSAALKVGLSDIAETFLDAAYDQANGFQVADLEFLIAEIRMAILARGHVTNLSSVQKELLGLSGAR